jgi:hypothetical protein
MTSILYRLAALLLLMASCKNYMPNESVDKKRSDETQILFLVFKIQSEKSQNSRIIFVEGTVSSGKIKSHQIIKTLSSYLIVTLINDSTLLDSIQVEHPLYREAEYLNVNGALSRKSIIAENAEFFARFKNQTAAKKVRVEEFVVGKKLQQIEFQIKSK